MKLNLRNRIGIRLLASILALCSAVLPAKLHAAEVKINNTSKNPMKLSDLFVFGAKGKQEIILHRRFAMDDEDIAPGETKSFPTSFPVIAVAMSITKNGKESELIIKEIDQKTGFQKMAWLENAGDGTDLFPFIDAPVAADPPEEGSIVSFVAGLNPQLPGWFVGTILDLDQGIVLNGFTGDAVVVQSDAAIAAVPEPASLTLLGLALLLLLRVVPVRSRL